MALIAALFLGLLSHSLEGTFRFAGDFNHPVQQVQLGPIKSITHLAQQPEFLRYEADQFAIIDGVIYTPVVYLEAPGSVRIKVGDDQNAFLFQVNKGGLSRVIIKDGLESQVPFATLLEDVTVSKN